MTVMKLFVCLIGTVVLLFARPNEACKRSPTPPPPASPPTQLKCPTILTADAHAGMAPLYSSSSDGNRNYIVVLNDDVDPENMKKQMDKMRSSGNNRIALTSCNALKAPSNGLKAVVADLDDDQLDKVRRMDGVKYVEKNIQVKASGSTNVWGLDRIDERWLPLDGNYSPTGNGDGVTVYVIDSGVNTNHVAFGGRAKNWHEVVTTWGEDCLGHGTHVAGTIAAATYGVATEVNIRSVRVFGCSIYTKEDNIINGINYILANGDSGSVVSMSLRSPQSVALDDAVNRLIQAGYVVVAAAGNDYQDACDYSPARVNEAITVGATDQSDKRVWFSNYGSGVDIFAPGEEIESLSSATNTGTTDESGTSMSAPHVAGVAAILLSRGVPASQVRQRIFDLSTKGVVKDSKGSNNRLLYID